MPGFASSWGRLDSARCGNPPAAPALL